MNLKEHIKTTYSINDIIRKFCNFLLDIFYKNPVSSHFYNKKLQNLKKKIENENISYIINITEGVGNQMFQYALAKKLAKEKNVLLNIPSKRKLHRRKYQLNGFNINLPTTDFEIKTKDIDFNLIKEKTPIKYDEKILNAPTSSYLKGYFQSYKYFDDIKDELIKDFKIKAEFTPEYKKMENVINKCESVLLNFRVGADYKKLGWMIDYNYHKEAISKIKELLPDKNLKFFIFADNIKEVKKHFIQKEDVVFVDLGKNNKDKVFLDLELMKNCKHDIITNSSYSFWAAYLNQNKYKIVIAPSPWLFNEDETVPPDWIRLKANKIKVKNPEII